MYLSISLAAQVFLCLINLVSAEHTHLHAGYITINSDKVIEKFDSNTMVPLEGGLVNIPPLGLIRWIGTVFSRPRFFPISLGVYTRTENISDIRFCESRHLVFVNENSYVQNYEYPLDQLSPEENPWSPKRRTIIVIPGYLTGDYEPWMHEIAEKWLQYEDVNVILVNWSEGNKKNAMLPENYDTAVSHTRIVARQVTIFLYYLSQVHGIDFDDPQYRDSFTLVGHSLGAHIAGFVGRELGGQVGRITGLDPAGVTFDTFPEEMHLNRFAAHFVDAIHTNAGQMVFMKAGLGLIKFAQSKLMSKISNQVVGSLLTTYTASNNAPWFGIKKPVGHLDYYANGGSIQPGCNDETHICDHSRAIRLYISQLEWRIFSENQPSETSREVREHQMVAFPSNSYDDFKSGISLLERCPELLVEDEFLISDHERFQAYRRCTVPLNFVATGKELRAELERYYNLPMVDWPGERRFFFDTLSGPPYITEHHMMRIHMDQGREEENHWSSGCHLSAIVKSSDEQLFSTIDYSNTDIPVRRMRLNNYPIYGLVLPYANPMNWRDSGIFPSPSEIRSSVEDTLKTKSEKIRFFTADHFEIDLTYKSDSIGTMRRAFTSLTQLVNGQSKSDAISSTPCQLAYEAFESRPLVSLAYNYSSWFTPNQNLHPLKVQSQQEMWDDPNLGARVTPSRLSSITAKLKLYLSAIVYGPKLRTYQPLN